jgi:flagellar basal body P-ring formation protein FlgA
MIVKHPALHLLVVLLCLVASGRASANVQTLDSIKATAEDFVRSHLPASNSKHFVSASNLDPRLRLQQCPSELEAFSHTAEIGARTTVGVRCTAGSTWTLYVPVTVEVEVPVLVLRRALARRARVALADVEPQVRRLPGSASNFITDIASLQGHRLKRALPAGSAITVDALAPDILVRRGQQVTLIAAVNGVEIRAQGQALTEGGAQERVRVQNVNSRKVVEGVVQSDSVVRVGL